MKMDLLQLHQHYYTQENAYLFESTRIYLTGKYRISGDLAHKMLPFDRLPEFLSSTGPLRTDIKWFCYSIRVWSSELKRSRNLITQNSHVSNLNELNYYPMLL
ncbi:hypothetical protein Droror1_Dr00010742 [Drosera rotundifolia]